MCAETQQLLFVEIAGSRARETFTNLYKATARCQRLKLLGWPAGVVDETGRDIAPPIDYVYEEQP